MEKKLKPILLSFVIVVTLWILVPVILMRLNTLLNLPVFINPVLKTSGLVVFSIGLFLTLSIVRGHLLTGRVTPVAVEPPNKFIRSGLYRYTRNPMYLAILITFLGGFMILGHFFLLLYVVLAFPAFHLFVIVKEEPELKRLFGNEYLEYTKKVPRWFPKFKS